jgi:hypothetical protein
MDKIQCNKYLRSYIKDENKYYTEGLDLTISAKLTWSTTIIKVYIDTSMNVPLLLEWPS